MPEQQPDDLTDEQRDYLVHVGMLTIATSTLDHLLRVLHTASTGDADNLKRSRDTLKREAKAAWRRDVTSGELDRDAVQLGSTWLSTALQLLDLRDNVTHAYWRLDPEAPHGLQGKHLASDANAPDLPSLRTLVSRVRAHVLDEALVPLFMHYWPEVVEDGQRT